MGQMNNGLAVPEVSVTLQSLGFALSGEEKNPKGEGCEGQA